MLKERWTDKEFHNSVIAQSDDEYYQESGYVIVERDGVASIGHYSHCSCYATFTSLCGGGISDSYDEGTVTWAWQGSIQELLDLAKGNFDYVVPGRQIDSEDCDADHLLDCYKQVLEWADKKNTLRIVI
jgi:hypothetical protein